MNDHIDGTADHFPDALLRKRKSAHGDHGFHARHSVSRRVGVERAHRAVMARIHRLYQVESFRSAHLADNDPLSFHAEAVSYEVTHADLPLAFKIWRAGFQSDY